MAPNLFYVCRSICCTSLYIPHKPFSVLCLFRCLFICLRASLEQALRLLGCGSDDSTKVVSVCRQNPFTLITMNSALQRSFLAIISYHVNEYLSSLPTVLQMLDRSDPIVTSETLSTSHRDVQIVVSTSSFKDTTIQSNETTFHLADATTLSSIYQSICCSNITKQVHVDAGMYTKALSPIRR